MIDKRLRIKIDSLAKQIMQMSGDLSELQDEMTALFDEVYDNGSDDGYEEAEKERKTAKETIAAEKCPHCKADTVVMHYNRGYRVECPNNTRGCNWYGVFHFNNQSEGSPATPRPSEAVNP